MNLLIQSCPGLRMAGDGCHCGGALASAGGLPCLICDKVPRGLEELPGGAEELGGVEALVREEVEGGESHLLTPTSGEAFHGVEEVWEGGRGEEGGWSGVGEGEGSTSSPQTGMFSWAWVEEVLGPGPRLQCQEVAERSSHLLSQLEELGARVKELAGRVAARAQEIRTKQENLVMMTNLVRKKEAVVAGLRAARLGQQADPAAGLAAAAKEQTADKGGEKKMKMGVKKEVEKPEVEVLEVKGGGGVEVETGEEGRGGVGAPGPGRHGAQGGARRCALGRAPRVGLAKRKR